MNISVRFEKDEIKKMVLDKAVAMFGTPPPGEEWTAWESYGTYKVENTPITQPDKTEAGEVKA